ncbi:MAG: methylenetetrahydrofolate--tRNA-(uracil(54)-C(5))-methyltransferase (FADH(2)-oxidizing) TrmFO [Myxococcota bacterium]
MRRSGKTSASTRGALPKLVVVGGGLAGCEAAWQAARRGVDVKLVEMRPTRCSPAHQSEDLAELVCSNSLRANGLANAVGLLKEEMRRLDSLVLRAADATAVPAGRALAVDRQAFSRHISDAIAAHPRIDLCREVAMRIPDAPLVILATGPLTATELAGELQQLLGEAYLYFYDAIAPTVYGDSIDPEVAFRASRYEPGEGDYLNLPLDSDQYSAFIDALLTAETVPLHRVESCLYFEGCLPIEELARRGRHTPAFGPMKPVGLVDPRTGSRPAAVVQLRREDKDGVLYNLVGFQTKLRIAEQRRIFRGLPGLSKAVFARYGSMHRNTYVNAPRLLRETLEVRTRPGLYLAGQMAGVEGYVESAALGIVAGVNAAFAARGMAPIIPPEDTAHGALLRYLINSDPKHFQPTNVNYGLFPALSAVPGRLPKREKNRRLTERALASLVSYRDASQQWLE